MGHPMGAAFGYAHLTGGYAGGQAEYVRVPYSDVGPIVIPDDLDDDQVLFLSDILPTGWMAAENAEIEPGDTVAVWGCGPVGLFAIQSALHHGRAPRDRHRPLSRTRLELAKQLGAEILDYREVDVREALDEMTGGIGPDAVHRLRRDGEPRPDHRQYRRHGEGARPSSAPSGRTRFGRRSSPAARAAESRSPASMAGSPTSSRSAS